MVKRLWFVGKQRALNANAISGEPAGCENGPTKKSGRDGQREIVRCRVVDFVASFTIDSLVDGAFFSHGESRPRNDC